MQPGQRRDEGRRWFERGLACERAGEGSTAAEHYRKAIALDPGLREARNALAFYYQRSGLFAKAADEFRAIGRLTDDYFAHYNLGYVLVEMERFDEAEREFRRCLELEPNDAASYLELAYVLLARQEYQAALTALEVPLTRYADDWEVHNLVSRCRIGLRDYEGAQLAIRNAWRLAPDFPAQAEILAQLGTLERHREFRHFDSIKDQVYAVDGVVYLGSAGDDGLMMRELQSRDFTLGDIALTVQRFVAFIGSSRRSVARIHALDSMSRPLARVLARALDVAEGDGQSSEADGLTVHVLAIGRSPDILTLARTRAEGQVLSFCLAVNWLKHSRMMPDVSGVIVHDSCTLPWEHQLRATDAEQFDAVVTEIADELFRALRGQIPEANLSRQMRYYTRSHRRLTHVAGGIEAGST